ncbi:hypothetical protein IFR05_011470 [Cadophora sp. M221]|nr:hypothetical protein IFR05_011470 [Cadophora sp. M221]
MAYHGPRGRVQSSMPGTYHESERDPYAYSPRSTKPKSPPPKARGYSFPPPPPLFDTSPEPYTYEDEEPERIPIAPMPWNGYSSSASKEELINYFIDRGFDPKVAAAQIDREFTAHAPQHLAGQTHAGLPRAQDPKPRAKQTYTPSSSATRKTPFSVPLWKEHPISRFKPETRILFIVEIPRYVSAKESWEI